MLTELNTAFWGDVLDTDRAVCVHDNWVRNGRNIYLNVAIDDVLDALIAGFPRERELAPAPAPPRDDRFR